MSIQLILSGDRLIVGEGSSLLDPAEEAAVYFAWILRHEPLPGDNREIGYEAMCQMLEEAGRPWPRPRGDAPAIEKMIDALEAGTIGEARFAEWVCLRVATA
jgi:hypothetical protein